MRVLAAVLAHAGHVAADVAGVEARLVERRIEQLDEPVVAPDQALVDARPWPAALVGRRPRRKAPTSSARWNRSGTRGSSRSRAACRRRSRRGGTRRHPIRAARCSRAAAVRRRQHSSAKGRIVALRARAVRTGAAPRRGRRPARRFRPCRACRPGSCRHSSRRSRSAAGRARRSATRSGWRARNARTARRIRADRPRQVVVGLVLGVDRRGLRGTARSRRGRRVSPVANT